MHLQFDWSSLSHLWHFAKFACVRVSLSQIAKSTKSSKLTRETKKVDWIRHFGFPGDLWSFSLSCQSWMCLHATNDSISNKSLLFWALDQLFTNFFLPLSLSLCLCSSTLVEFLTLLLRFVLLCLSALPVCGWPRVGVVLCCCCLDHARN